MLERFNVIVEKKKEVVHFQEHERAIQWVIIYLFTFVKLYTNTVYKLWILWEEKAQMVSPKFVHKIVYLRIIFFDEIKVPVSLQWHQWVLSKKLRFSVRTTVLNAKGTYLSVSICLSLLGCLHVWCSLFWVTWVSGFVRLKVLRVLRFCECYIAKNVMTLQAEAFWNLS